MVCSNKHSQSAHTYAQFNWSKFSAHSGPDWKIVPTYVCLSMVTFRKLAWIQLAILTLQESSCLLASYIAADVNHDHANKAHLYQGAWGQGGHLPSWGHPNLLQPSPFFTKPKHRSSSSFKKSESLARQLLYHTLLLSKSTIVKEYATAETCYNNATYQHLGNRPTGAVLRSTTSKSMQVHCTPSLLVRN